jgi:hypothetical protein
MAIQTTYSNEKRERRAMGKGQTTPYLNMLRTSIPSIRIEVIEDTAISPRSTRVRRRMLCSIASSPHCQHVEKRRPLLNSRYWENRPAT